MLNRVQENGASNIPPVNLQLLISSFAWKGHRAGITALALSLSFARGSIPSRGAPAQQEGCRRSAAGSAVPEVGLTARKWLSDVSGPLGNRGGCEGELLEERGRFSGKCIFVPMKNFRRVPSQQRKAVHELQSPSLPKPSRRAPCQDPALASCANTVSTQISFVPKKQRFREASLVPRSPGEEGRRDTVSHGNCRGHSVITRGPG